MSYQVTPPVACPGTVAVVTDTAPHPSHTALPAYVVARPIGTGAEATSVLPSVHKCETCSGAGWLPKGKCPDCQGLGRAPVLSEPTGD